MDGTATQAALRLLVETPEGVSQDERTVRQALLATLGPDARGRPWRVARLFPGEDSPELRRHFVATGAVPLGITYDLSQAGYDLAAEVNAATGFAVEPDVPSAAYGVEPDQQAGAGDLESLGDTRGTHLPASEPRTWVLDAVNARAAWDMAGAAARGAGIAVGHADTGYTDHPGLEQDAFDLLRDWDFVAGDDDARDPLERRIWWPLDSPGHGTHTGSVIASRGAAGVMGVAPAATLVPLRAVRSVVQVLDSDVARAVDHARRSRCHVVSMSLGGRGFSGLRAAIRAATDAGLIVMAAAGNKVGIVTAPASYRECIAVAAVNADGLPWTGSSRGREVDVAAPGESVWVASVDAAPRPPQYLVRRHHGTSFAVATLAGVAALWLAHHGRDTIIATYGRPNVHRAFIALAKAHARPWSDPAHAARFGAGIVDAAALLEVGLPAIEDLEAEAVEAVDTPLARLAAVNADLSRAEVVSATEAVMGASPEALAPHQVSELVYRLGQDQELRARFAACAVPADAETLAPPDIAAFAALVARSGSRALSQAAHGGAR